MSAAQPGSLLMGTRGVECLLALIIAFICVVMFQPTVSQTITDQKPQSLNSRYTTFDSVITRDRFYGSGLNADDITNTRIGGPTFDITDIRFRADRKVRLASVRLYLMWGFAPEGL